MNFMTALAGIPGAAPVLPYVAGLIALCAALAVVLPRPASGATSPYAVIYAAVNLVALNFGQARNASAPVVPVSAATPCIAAMPAASATADTIAPASHA